MIRAMHSHTGWCEIPRFTDRAWEANQRQRRVDAESARETPGQALTFDVQDGVGKGAWDLVAPPIAKTQKVLAVGELAVAAVGCTLEPAMMACTAVSEQCCRRGSPRFPPAVHQGLPLWSPASTRGGHAGGHPQRSFRASRQPSHTTSLGTPVAAATTADRARMIVERSNGCASYFCASLGRKISHLTLLSPAPCSHPDALTPKADTISESLHVAHG